MGRGAVVVTGGRTGRRHGDGRRIMSRFVSLSLSHTHVDRGRAQREEVHARRTYSRLFPNHTRAGTRWSSFLYEKGSPRDNLARVLVVHLVEGGSSTTGEQTNCDLTSYVKLKKGQTMWGLP